MVYLNASHSDILQALLAHQPTTRRPALIVAPTGKVHEISNTVTAELTIKYLKPVITPQTLLLRVWLVKMEGRKGWIDGAIEDANGVAMVKGSGFFIQLRPSKI